MYSIEGSESWIMWYRQDGGWVTRHLGSSVVKKLLFFLAIFKFAISSYHKLLNLVNQIFFIVINIDNQFVE